MNYFFATLKCEFRPALTYSPPISRITWAIFAKLSEPRNLLGFTIMRLPVSSNSSMPASSGVKAFLTSLMSIFPEPKGAVAVEGVGVDVEVVVPVAVLRDWETSLRSFAMVFSRVSRSSTFWARFSRLGFSSPINSNSLQQVTVSSLFCVFLF